MFKYAKNHAKWFSLLKIGAVKRIVAQVVAWVLAHRVDARIKRRAMHWMLTVLKVQAFG